MKPRRGCFVFVVLVCFISCPSFAAPDPGIALDSLQTIYEWESPPGEATQGYVSVSPDGQWLLRIGKDPIKGVQDSSTLYVRNADTNEEKAVFFGKDYITEAVFTPDSKNILFISRHRTGPESDTAFRLNFRKPTTPTPVTSNCDEDTRRCTLANPAFSPDGNKLAFTVVVWKKIGNERSPYEQWLGQPGTDLPNLPQGHPESYTGVLPANAQKKTPIRIVDGNVFFWSTDSKAVYIVGITGILTRFNVMTKISSSIMPLTGQLADIGPRTETVPGSGQQYIVPPPQGSICLGKMPEKDAIFVTNGKTVEALALDNHTRLDSDLAKAVQTIKVLDSKDRILKSVQAVGNNRIFLRYHDQGNDKMSSKIHVKLLQY